MTWMTAEIIIERIETGYTEIMNLYQAMPEAALMEPVFANGWSPKDTVGHLAAKGSRPLYLWVGQSLDIDQVNDIIPTLEIA